MHLTNNIDITMEIIKTVETSNNIRVFGIGIPKICNEPWMNSKKREGLTKLEQANGKLK